ncbi:flagellar export protein FliJ [Deltaproteobacteria bacterium TL4]
MPRYRLQTALDVRERVEKLKQKDVAQQLQVVQKIKDEILGIEDSMAQSSQAVNRSKSEGFTIMQLRFNDNFQKRAKQRILILKEQMRQQQQVLAVKQKALLKAAQGKKVLEILKGKEEKRYKEKMEYLERSEMDEIAINRHRFTKQT